MTLARSMTAGPSLMSAKIANLLPRKINRFEARQSQMSAVYYAIFPDSIRCHPTQKEGHETLCGIPTRKGKQHPLRPYPPARLLPRRPPGYLPCPRCEEAATEVQHED